MKRKLYLVAAISSLISMNSFAQYPTIGLVEYYSFNNTLNAEIIPATHDFTALLSSNYATSTYNGSIHEVYSKTSGNNVLMTNDNITGFPTGDNAFTICFWLKLNNNTISSIFNYTGSFTPVIGFPNSTEDDVDGIYMTYDSGNFDVGTMDSGSFISNLLVGYTYNSNWHHVTLAHSPSNTSVFIDGVNIGTSTTGVFNTNDYPNSTLRIGQSPGLQSFGTFDIDEFLIYNRFLNTTEITTVMNSNSISQTSGLNELETTSISVYPNPTNDVLNVSFESENSSAFSIYSADNREVLSGELIAGNNTIDVQKLAVGSYFLKTTINGALVTKKISIQ